MGRYAFINKLAGTATSTSDNGQTMSVLAAEVATDWNQVDHTFTFGAGDAVVTSGMTVGTNQITINAPGDYLVEMDWSVWWGRGGVGWGQIIVNGTVKGVNWENYEDNISGNYWGGSCFAVLTLTSGDVLTFGYNRFNVSVDSTVRVHGLGITVRQLTGEYYYQHRRLTAMGSPAGIVYQHNTSDTTDWDAFNTIVPLDQTPTEEVVGGTAISNDFANNELDISSTGKYFAMYQVACRFDTITGWVYPAIYKYNGAVYTLMGVQASNAQKTNGRRRAARAIGASSITSGERIRYSLGSNTDQLEVMAYSVFAMKLG